MQKIFRTILAIIGLILSSITLSIFIQSNTTNFSKNDYLFGLYILCLFISAILILFRKLSLSCLIINILIMIITITFRFQIPSIAAIYTYFLAYDILSSLICIHYLKKHTKNENN